MSENATTSHTLFPDLGARHVATLRVALRLFTEKGFFNTSIQDIGRAAEVSVGFMYHHFTDKEGIAFALYHHLLARLNVLLDEIEASHALAEDRCFAVIKMLFDLTESEPDVMAFVVNAQHREFLPQAKAICSASAFVRMRGFVAAGIRNKEIQEMGPAVAAAIMYGGAIRMVCLRLDGIIPDSLDNHLDELWRNTWKSFAL